MSPAPRDGDHGPDGDHHGPDPGGSSEAACLREILHEAVARDVLDVGCGDGRFTRLLGEQLPRARSIVGMDPDKDSLDEARVLTDDRRIRFRLRAALEMRFHDERFDLVSLAHVLHHVGDPAAVLDRVRRVLRRDGWLIVEEPVADGLSEAERNGRDVHHWKAAVDRGHGLTHRETLTRDRIRALLREAGIVVDAEREIRDGRPASPDSGEALQALEFMADYRTLADGLADAEVHRDESARIAAAIAAAGIASPPRLLIRARFRPDW